MKKILSIAVLTSLLVLPVLVLPVLVAAQEEPEGPIDLPDWEDVDICCADDSLIGRITIWLFGGLLFIAAIALIIAAYYFVTAAGDPDKVKKSRDFVLYALIGVIIAIAARGLVYFIGKVVGVT